MFLLLDQRHITCQTINLKMLTKWFDSGIILFPGAQVVMVK